MAELNVFEYSGTANCDFEKNLALNVEKFYVKTFLSIHEP